MLFTIISILIRFIFSTFSIPIQQKNRTNISEIIIGKRWVILTKHFHKINALEINSKKLHYRN
ncbi:unnamed protein product [Brugia timori]|uniref:Uncharacterized protein n=1 Tax=Brugia timori TaxID=42155 RepID=A0A3P7T2E6_9BILA|nr:unnamed protein product [Brugia timori]